MVDETLKRRNACLNSMANRLGMITHHQYNIENGDLNTVEWNEGTIVKTDPTIIAIVVQHHVCMSTVVMINRVEWSMTKNVLSIEF